MPEPIRARTSWAAERERAADRRLLKDLGGRRPGFLAELGWKRWQAGKVDDVVSLAPIYLHVAEEIPD